jgi:hypothetical protein
MQRVMHSIATDHDGSPVAEASGKKHTMRIACLHIMKMSEFSLNSYVEEVKSHTLGSKSHFVVLYICGQ